MKMKWYMAIWLCVPAFLLAWHYGPGQTYLHRDIAAEHIEQARVAAESEDWESVYISLKDAEAALPAEDRVQKMELQYASAAARIKAGNILEGIEQLQELLDESDNTDPGSPKFMDADLKARVRNELASAAYYAGWIMRVHESATPAEWKPEVERARQQFRMLAEDAKAKGDAGKSETYQKNLESTIRLEHMDLSDLAALPFPKDCPKCNGSLSQKKRKQRMAKSKGKKEGEGKGDAREKIQEQKDAAGQSPREGSGS